MRWEALQGVWAERRHPATICEELGTTLGASQVVLVVENLPVSAEDIKRCGFDPWVGKVPWRRAQQPTPVFSPGETHGQRSLVGYSP